jgi:hypothetical protein
MTNINDINTHFSEHGWAVIDFSNRDAVLEARDNILSHVKATYYPSLERLEDLHEHIPDDDAYVQLHLALTEYYRKEGLSLKIMAGEVDMFRQFMGPDINIQKNPYLRIARPGATGDNIGYHRDTFYGASPFEISVFVPLTDLSEGNALQFLSGSNDTSDDTYPFEQFDNEGIERGSPRHLAGIPYAPRIIKPEEVPDITPVPVTVGQAVIFGLSNVHGQVVNEDKTTRVSTDIRLVNALAPFPESRGGGDEYYLQFLRSPLTEQASRYLEANNITKITKMQPRDK